MGFARRIDDALVDVAQGLVAKLATRTGGGRESILRDAYLTCALVCGGWAVLVATDLGAMPMMVPLVFGVLDLVDAFVHDRLARRENTLDGWRCCVARASEERIRGLWLRLSRILMTMLAALSTVGILALLILAGDPSPFAESASMFGMAVWFVASTVTKYLEATQPPSPGASKAIMVPPNAAAASGR